MKKDQITEETIKELVDIFYGKVSRDEDLGPIFRNVIGEGEEAWRPHLETMYNFWSSIFLGSGRYNGRPCRNI
jgi:hemoglobin